MKELDLADRLWADSVDCVARSEGARERALMLAFALTAEAAANSGDDAVREIRSSTLTGRVLARKYGVSESAVSLVRCGKAWRHLL